MSLFHWSQDLASAFLPVAASSAEEKPQWFQFSPRHIYLFDLHSIHQSKRKIQVQALTEVLREYSTVEIQKAIPALEMSSTYFKIKVCEYIQIQISWFFK